MSPSLCRTEESPWAGRLSAQAGVNLRVIHTPAGRLALRAGDEGIELRWPQRVDADLVENFLERQKGWIDRQQQRYADLAQAWERVRCWQPGAASRLLLFGQLRDIRFSPGKGGFALAPDGRIELGCPGPGEAARRTLAAGALALLQQDLATYARELAQQAGLKARALSFRSMRSLWGSCSADGRIRLNSALVFVPPAVARYVLAHEAAHLKVRDHSPRFWTVVQALMPDYAKHRLVLRREHAVILRLGEWLYARSRSP